MRFHDRVDAGRQLAAQLTRYGGRPDVVVLGLPRGGVPIAAAVAGELGAVLDVFLVRKLGVPGHAELAMGAIASGGVLVVNHEIIRELHISADAIAEVTACERIELERREHLYRENRQLPSLTNRIAILVDDGLATGATMEAAIAALRQYSPRQIVVAAPVGAPETCARLQALADEVVCVEKPPHFQAVGLWYERFDQTTDDEVIAALRAAASRRDVRREPSPAPAS